MNDTPKLMVFLMLVAVLGCHASGNPGGIIKADFEVNSAFINKIELSNKSAHADYFSWVISRDGNILFETVTEHPVFTLEATGEIDIQLTAFGAFGSDVYEQSVQVSEFCHVSIVNEAGLFCSQHTGAHYWATVCDGYTYKWITPSDYIRAVSGENTSELKVDWGGSSMQEPTQLQIALKVQSLEGITQYYFDDILLVHHQLPGEGRLIRKAPQSNVLIYLTEDVETYLYNWRQISGAGVIEIDTTVRKNFYEFAMSPASTYQVSVIRDAYKYCQVTHVYRAEGAVSHLQTDGFDEEANMLLVSKNPLMTIYPNPASDFINLRFNLVDSKSAVIHLYDIHGRVKINKIVNDLALTNNYQIRLPELVSGVYFLQVVTDDQIHFVEKLFVR